MYQEYFTKALKHVLNKFPQCEKKLRGFTDNILVLAYFRLPDFRHKLLSSIIRKDDEISEWRFHEWGIDEKVTDDMRESSLISQFSWEKDFNHYLKTHTHGTKLHEEIQLIVNSESWQKRFHERNETFFYFLCEWNHYVHKKMLFKNHIPWQDLPGYRILLKSFLVELKNREIVKYPETLKRAASEFLLNEKLLNIFLSLLYNKTKVYDAPSTFITFEMINEWLKAILQHKKILPSFFEFSFFLEGITKVLEQDHAYSIAKCLLTIYNNFVLFSGWCF